MMPRGKTLLATGALTAVLALSLALELGQFEGPVIFGAVSLHSLALGRGLRRRWPTGLFLASVAGSAVALLIALLDSSGVPRLEGPYVLASAVLVGGFVTGLAASLWLDRPRRAQGFLGYYGLR